MKFNLTLQLMMATAIAGSTEAARGDTVKEQLRDNKKRVLKKDKSSGGGGGGGSGPSGSGFWNHIWNQVHGGAGSPDASDPNNEFGYDGSNYQNDIVNGNGFPGTYPEGTPSKYLPDQDIPYGPAPGTSGYTGYGVRGYPDRNGD